MKKQNKTNCEQVTKEIKKEVKAERKFNVKAWLIASTFSIISATVGIVNLILALTKNK